MVAQRQILVKATSEQSLDLPAEFGVFAAVAERLMRAGFFEEVESRLQLNRRPGYAGVAGFLSLATRLAPDGSMVEEISFVFLDMGVVYQHQRCCS